MIVECLFFICEGGLRNLHDSNLPKMPRAHFPLFKLGTCISSSTKLVHAVVVLQSNFTLFYVRLIQFCGVR